MDVEVTRTITYRGKPPWHTALVQFLEEEGVRVEWSPPSVEEPRGIGADVNQVVVNLISTGTVAAIALAVRKFRNYGPQSKGKVDVEGEPQDEDGAEHEADVEGEPPAENGGEHEADLEDGGEHDTD